MNQPKNKGWGGKWSLDNDWRNLSYLANPKFEDWRKRDRGQLRFILWCDNEEWSDGDWQLKLYISFDNIGWVMMESLRIYDDEEEKWFSNS